MDSPGSTPEMGPCPICDKTVVLAKINAHLDSECKTHLWVEGASAQNGTPSTQSTQKQGSVSSYFQTPVSKKNSLVVTPASRVFQKPPIPQTAVQTQATKIEKKRSYDAINGNNGEARTPSIAHTALASPSLEQQGGASAKRPKTNAFEKAMPLAERMRPRTLDEVCGQELVGPTGVLRNLIEQDQVPSMILWGGAGTGKTTIARCVAANVGSRFVEINSTSSGVGECKEIFAKAKNELGLTGRKTIIFCDEIHRFSKSQQDVFLGPVESGQITLIGATTENPSFKIQNALLSRCRTFTLQKLTTDNLKAILHRALETDGAFDTPPSGLIDEELIAYLSAFADGDARTALNLLELAVSISNRPNITKDDIKLALTKTLVYDRAGDQHYDTISAFHKSIRGSDPGASLYYLARMLQSGEDPLYIARRLVVVASEDVGLADNTMLSLATATYSACEKLGMPECRINLAHCTAALAEAPKSTRAYRSLGNAYSALKEPGVAGLPIPLHLRNAPTRMMKEMGYGQAYKYNPEYCDGKVKQEYLPGQLKGREFMEKNHLGTKIDRES